jgi:iron(III) transport system substrate-binding protein
LFEEDVDMSIILAKRLISGFAFGTLLMLGVVTANTSKAFAGAEGGDVAGLIKGAQKEGKILVYTTMTVEDSSRLLNRFKEKYPFLQGELIRSSGTQVVTRILADAKANAHPDVILADGFAVHYLKVKGLLQRYLSAERGAYADGFKDPDGYYTSSYTSTMVVAYNTRLVSPNAAPKGYEDLLDPKWKGKMGMESDDIEWFASMLKILGREKGLRFMRELSKQDLTLRKGHTLNTALLAAGEFAVAVNVFGHRVEKLKEERAPIEWVPAKGIISRLNPVGVAAYARHPNAGKLYVDFVLSREGQTIIRDFRRIPSRLDVAPIPARLTEGLELIPSDITLATNLSAYTKEFREIFHRE